MALTALIAECIMLFLGVQFGLRSMHFIATRGNKYGTKKSQNISFCLRCRGSFLTYLLGLLCSFLLPLCSK